jgi:hypothetical protein
MIGDPPAWQNQTIGLIKPLRRRERRLPQKPKRKTSRPVVDVWQGFTKDEIREAAAALIERYLANGGAITQCRPQVYRAQGYWHESGLVSSSMKGQAQHTETEAFFAGDRRGSVSRYRDHPTPKVLFDKHFDDPGPIADHTTISASSTHQTEPKWDKPCHKPTGESGPHPMSSTMSGKSRSMNRAA